MKTRAEQSYADQFEAVSGRLPGADHIKAARRSAMGSFGLLGLPHRRVEEWKYTDIRALLKEAYAPSDAREVLLSRADIDNALGELADIDAERAVFVDGRFRAELSDLARDPGGAFEALASALKRPMENAAMSVIGRGTPTDGIVALNTAFMTDGAVITISDGAKIDRPLHLVFVRAGRAAQAIATRNIIKVGKNADVTLIETFVALQGAAEVGQANALTDIAIADGAAVRHVKILVCKGETHLSTSSVDVGAAASYRCFHYSESPGLARNQVNVRFSGEGSKIDLSGTFFVRGSEHVDTTLVVDHAVPHCESRELFKGVLDGHGRGVFQGKIIVRPDAQKTDGKMMAQVLMLSPDGEFDSKPELEIYADDVVCGHGSTVAEIDPDLMFYCRSRGIPPAEAMTLLVTSFTGEALAKLEHDGLRAALEVRAARWLVG